MRMANPMTTPDEFAAAMQQLSAEAQKTLTLGGSEDQADAGSAFSKVAWEVRGLSNRLENLERAVTKKIDNLAASSTEKPVDIAPQFQKIDEQLTAIGSTESVHQKLFDTLHAELLKYRDNFLHESLQKPFIHDLVLLFDHLTSLCEQLSTAAQSKNRQGRLGQWRENLENAIHALMEILHRLEVKEIEPKDR